MPGPFPAPPTFKGKALGTRLVDISDSHTAIMLNSFVITPTQFFWEYPPPRIEYQDSSEKHKPDRLLINLSFWQAVWLSLDS